MSEITQEQVKIAETDRFKNTVGSVEEKIFNPKWQKRFMAKVSILPLPNCWEWQSTKTVNGYGYIHVVAPIKDGKQKKKMYLAHRVSYQIFNRRLLPGESIMHNCDNRLCCNPYHLKIGSHKENMRDMVLKGRSASGESQGHSVLTQKDVDNIRKCRELDPKIFTHKKLGDLYGVCRSTITHIFAKTTW